MKYGIVIVSFMCTLLMTINVRPVEFINNSVFQNSELFEKIGSVVAKNAELIVAVSRKIDQKDFAGVQDVVYSMVKDGKLDVANLIEHLVELIGVVQKKANVMAIDTFVSVSDEQQAMANAIVKKVVELSPKIEEYKQFLINLAVNLRNNPVVLEMYMNNVSNFIRELVEPKNDILQAIDFNSINKAFLSIYDNELAKLYGAMAAEEITGNKLIGALENIVKIMHKQEFDVIKILPLLKMVKNETIINTYPPLIAQLLALLELVNKKLNAVRQVDPDAAWHVYVPTLPAHLQESLSVLVKNPSLIHEQVMTTLKNIRAKILTYIQPK